MTTCRLIEKDGYPKEIGDMWFDGLDAEEMSDEYRRDWLGKREPLYVVLPDRTRFCLDQRSSTAREEGTHEGWTITGDPPSMSAVPSIHIQSGPMPDGSMLTLWHGYLTNGELIG